MFEQFAQHTIEDALREAIEQVDEEKISKSVLAPILGFAIALVMIDL